MEIETTKSIFCKLSENNSYLNYIPSVNNISYRDFFEQYLLKNQACIIKNVAGNWVASIDWLTETGEINYEFLYGHYGLRDITVYDCNSKYYNSQTTKNMKLMHYLVYWEAYMKNNYSKDFPLLYLKDWHLRNELPTDNFYEVPVYFASDWMNEYLVENNMDDYRFVYMGPKGTWTPFHADVFSSYSWSTNVFGTKRWILYPPGEEDTLKDSMGNLPYDVEDPQGNFLEIIQKPGDAIFVPSGWYHQVWNVTDSISVNHNWINGCNIKLMWLDIVKHYKLVVNEINDCRESDTFLHECQIFLKAHYGIDFSIFYNFINFIAKKRLEMLRLNEYTLVSGFYKLGQNHAIFDVECIREVLGLFIKEKDVHVIEEGKLLLGAMELLGDIDVFFNIIDANEQTTSSCIE